MKARFHSHFPEDLILEVKQEPVTAPESTPLLRLVASDSYNKWADMPPLEEHVTEGNLDTQSKPTQLALDKSVTRDKVPVVTGTNSMTYLPVF